jgi:RNA polymerase sigma-70 factor (ECF subfamily)
MSALALRQVDAAPLAAPNSDADAALVGRAASGDATAFEALYRKHVGRVHGAIWRLVGRNQARADELTQDAFVRAWKKLPEFRFESAFGTWLYRLSINVALMDLRGRSGAEDLEDELLDQAESHAHGESGARGELRLDLERVVAKLPPRARAVLVLHDVEGWKHEEIGRELGMAVGSSKAQLHRARRLLRKWLGGGHE